MHYVHVCLVLGIPEVGSGMASPILSRGGGSPLCNLLPKASVESVNTKSTKYKVQLLARLKPSPVYLPPSALHAFPAFFFFFLIMNEKNSIFPISIKKEKEYQVKYQLNKKSQFVCSLKYTSGVLHSYFLYTHLSWVRSSLNTVKKHFFTITSSLQNILNKSCNAVPYESLQELFSLILVMWRLHIDFKYHNLIRI